MRTHIATIEPNVFPRYQQVAFEVRIRCGEPLCAGTIVECQLPNSFNSTDVSPSKVKDWQIDRPDSAHHISVRAGSLQSESLRIRVIPREYIGGYASPNRHGRCVVIELLAGTVAAGEEVVIRFENTTSSWLANQAPGETDHEGVVFVRIDGHVLGNLPTYRVAPGPEAYRRIIVPSAAKPGELFRVLLVSLDSYNNLSSTTHTGCTLRCGGLTLVDGFSYTGRIELEVSLEQTGVHRLECGGVRSNPIRVGVDAAGPYWGDIHFHNYPSVDAIGNTPYRYARDVSGLDFAATTEHGAGGLPAHWAQTRQWCREWYEPGRFVTILGLETNTKWHHNLYFYDESVPMVDAQKSGDSLVTSAQLLEYTRDKRVVTQIHHTGWGFDMRRRYPDTTRLFEVYSMHGTSEVYDPGGPLFMDDARHRPGTAKAGPYYLRDALALGQRFVVHGSSDNHFGQPGVRYNSVTGLYSDCLDRESVLDALVAGRCYATTGERIILEFEIDGLPMGSEVTAAEDRVSVRIAVNGTDTLDTVEVFSGVVIEGDRSVDIDRFMFADGDPRVDDARNSWSAIYRKDNFDVPDFEDSFSIPLDGRNRVYYLRVRQRTAITLPAPIEGAANPQTRPVMAWSSPIWVFVE